MTIVHIDFETRSEADIKKVGAWKYSQDPTTEILCLAYCIDDGPVKLIRTFLDEGYAKLLEMAETEDVIFYAHNAFFEQSIWHNIVHKRNEWPDIAIERWRCSAAKAASYALPRALGNCGAALRLETQKDNEGHGIMLQLSKPRRPSKENPDRFWEPDKVPEKFQALYNYCVTDVESERAISHSLRDLNKTEQQVWLLDQKINRRGISVDTEAVNAALYLVNKFSDRAKEEVQRITQDGVASLSQRNKVLGWIQSRGVELTGLTKADVSAALEGELPEDVRAVLRLRQQVGKTSTAKYKAIKAAVCEDNRLRDTLMYHGASTGRWSGKLVQLQNIPRGSVKDTDNCIEVVKQRDLDWLETLYDDPMEAISSCLRGMFIASPGCKLIVADYSSIEARVLVWLAKDRDAVQRFHQGVDTYIDMACQIYDILPENVTKDQRQLGKQAVLGCGYGMGIPKFQATCATYGMDVDEDLAEKAVTAYREKYSSVQKLWWGTEEVAQAAVADPGRAKGYAGVHWVKKGRFLYCKLPSGRLLSYCEPKLEMVMTPWGEEKRQLTFMGVNSVTKKWERQSTYGGKLVENITQAVARDIMAEAMLRVEDEGFKVLLSVHDELITEIPQDTYLKNPVERLEQLMCIHPDWALDADVGSIPINAEGWQGERYKK
jgi:DNA polymerase